MTNKQIIIDGADVTQCGFFSKVEGKQTNVCYIMPCHELETEKFIGYLECSTNHNCYYKQLKRKEQECEELKDKLRTKARGWANVNDQILKEVDQIKADNEELTSKCSQLKQTLAEIKSILEYYENAKIGEKQEDGSYKLEFTFSDIATPYCINYDPKPAREALRKINEVEDDRT
jgi:septal ring factor EnvC (AmiA/AmiB activator)